MKCRWSVTPGGEGDYCASLPVFEHRELQNLACARSRRSPAPLRAARAAAAGFTRNCFGSRPTRTAGQRRGSGRRLPRPGAAAGPLLPPPPPRGRRAPPDWPQRGDPGKVPRRREAARRQPRRMGGRAGFFEVGAGGAASRRGEPGPGPAASCRRRTGLPGVPADGSLLPLLLHWSAGEPEPSAPGSAKVSDRRCEPGGGSRGGHAARRAFLRARGQKRPPPAPSFPSLPRACSSPPRPRWSSDVAPERRGGVGGCPRAPGRLSAVRGGAGSMALGFPRILPRVCRGQPAGVGLAAHPSRRERARARNVLGTFCPQLLGRACRQPPRSSPRAVPPSLPARCGRAPGGESAPRGGSGRLAGAEPARE